MTVRTLTQTNRLDLAKKLWQWVPHPTQREWLLDDHPVKVAACGRRWGKTEAAAVDIAVSAIVEQGSTQIIVAPTYDQSRLISGTVERLLMSNPMTRKRAHIVKTPYPDIRIMGSRIMARTADDDGRNLRGFSADRVIVDEAAYARDQVVEEVIGPMLADRNGRLVMISTPYGKNHFYRAFTRGIEGTDPRCRAFRFPSWTNPHINREYVEYQRSVLTPRQFKVEYEAEFADDEVSVFPWADIQAAADAFEPERASGRPVYVAGIDWARYSDYTAVVILELLPQAVGSVRYRVAALDRFNRMEWKEQVQRVAEILCRYRVMGIAADQTSVGDPVLEMLKRRLWDEMRMDAGIEGVVFTSQSKREMIDNLAIRLAHREVAFPGMETLVRELQFYEYDVTSAGNVRTGARRGCHDDCVCALALALRVAPHYAVTENLATSGKLRTSVGGW
ncbi:MAG: terminase large subunit domain-containing protein [Armatimonadota bacterium]